MPTNESQNVPSNPIGGTVSLRTDPSTQNITGTYLGRSATATETFWDTVAPRNRSTIVHCGFCGVKMVPKSKQYTYRTSDGVKLYATITNVCPKYFGFFGWIRKHWDNNEHSRTVYFAQDTLENEAV